MKLSDIAIQKVQDHTSAGTSTVTSDAIDMQGYEELLVITSFGTAASNNTLKAQQSSDDGSSDGYSDLEGSSVASGTSDEDVWFHLYRPSKRYVKVVGTRGTSSTLESIWALKSGGRKLPVDNTTSGTIIGESSAEPAEGTA